MLKREEKRQKQTLQKLKEAPVETVPKQVRRGNKGFNVSEDPLVSAWYDDKSESLGPEKPWQQRR